jgi:site-specific DNA recombinase
VKPPAAASNSEGSASSRPLRAIAYLRVSTAGQAEKGMGLQAQRHAVLDYAAAKGLSLVGIVQETASGGVRGDEVFSWEHRPVLLSIMQRAKSGEFDALVVARLDRLSRDHATLTILERELQRFGVEVVSVAEENGDGPMAKFIRGQLALVAELERAMILTRVAAGKIEGRKAGRHVAGKIAYGYRRGSEAGRLEVDEAQAEVVRRIFLLAREGRGPGPISRRLNAEGIAGPADHPWSRQTITKMLRNPVYAGELHGVKKAQPAIVSRRLWNAVQR